MSIKLKKKKKDYKSGTQSRPINEEESTNNRNSSGTIRSKPLESSKVHLDTPVVVKKKKKKKRKPKFKPRKRYITNPYPNTGGEGESGEYGGEGGE